MTDARVRDDIRAMSAKERKPPQLDPAPNAPPQNSRRGVATTPQSAGGTGGETGSGIASPLTEQNYGDREYYGNSYFLSGNMLLAIEVKPLKKIKMLDDEQNEVVLNFAEPSNV